MPDTSPFRPSQRFVEDPYAGLRRRTREVRVGDVVIGGNHPLVLQSMTTTDTLDIRGTADQSQRLTDAGCQIVRITAPSIREAEALRDIVKELRGRGVTAPIVADIHFTPNAAMIAAECVEKVRINPGNYADRKKFEVREYDDRQYAAELARVAERFRPLVRRCKQNGVALRIGTNHGSLSDRIMNRHGDTPLGMVESAIEFLDVCEDENFHDVVFSMKASNTQVAIQAYRMLAERLEARAPGQPGYPFHVGVTEAGDAEDGRIKSAIGIGSLLEDGIGDTLRVSLTEDPVKEIPVAAELARRAQAHWSKNSAAAKAPIEIGSQFVADVYSHARRATSLTNFGGLSIGGGEPPRVELDLGELPIEVVAIAAKLSTAFALNPDLLCEGLSVDVRSDADCERVIALRSALQSLSIQVPIAERHPLDSERLTSNASRVVFQVLPSASAAALTGAARAALRAGVGLEWCLIAELSDLPRLVEAALAAATPAHRHQLAFSVESSRSVHAVRLVSAKLSELGAADLPVLLRHRRAAELSSDTTLLEAAIEVGAPLCDGIGDAVSLRGYPDPGAAIDLAYRVLQGARLRTTRTEYISCPSCGRTQFDLEETTARIKARTEHLKGVKIAVMGCIVNGPGEMADADFGYVGSGVGRVNLYVEKNVIARNVPEAAAPDRLIELIREHGRWVEPASKQPS